MLICVVYGALSYRWDFFPSPILKSAISGYKEVSQDWGTGLPWGYVKLEENDSVSLVKEEHPLMGLNLVTRMASDNALVVELLAMDSTLVKQWSLNWFDIWPDADHLPEHIMPKSEPGTFIHGVVLLPDGSIVFNYEYCGMVRIDKNDKVVWKLPYATHHSLHLAENGNLWACGLLFEPPKLKALSNCELVERQVIVEVSQQGEILNEWRVEELIANSGLKGYLHLMKRECGAAQLLHLNDVETIASTDTSGWFQSGDVLFSLRNINTVFVFNRFTNKIRKAISGPFIAQHDPDFKSGNSITVFDNGHGANASSIKKSRIVQVDLVSGKAETLVEGSVDLPFYSEKLGKHQWLSNGNLLITSSQQGRAYEINTKGDVVWEYFNRVTENSFGYLIDVQRVPMSHADLF